MAIEQPFKKGPEEKKEEAGAEEKSNLIIRLARGILHGVGRIGYPEEIQKEDEEGEKQKKASKRMERLKFGGSILGAGVLMALAGTIALPFWGMKKILQADKDFMRLINAVKG